ncbi:serine/threonine-protein kinase [uncultured Paludibaculum sp.]|uniref:serine/threonine-protein kinase n=1 Tax=uncultured Paludibaculum sp. TaxID=1765020 RepID=UPI002AAB416A|nr:serine/threonine-protein kinase [uncultured Paludibaculum sp.]
MAWIQESGAPSDVVAEAVRLVHEYLSAGADFLAAVTRTPDELLERAAQAIAVSSERTTAPGKVVAGRYEIVRELGSGGGGIVYLAHDRSLHQRPVVLKFPYPGGESQDRLLSRFRQEIEALARIRHPGVVGALDVGTATGRVFLVMEYVEGATLRSHLGSPMPASRVADVIGQIADALCAAHQAGILHRDLKPENVMLQGTARGVELVKLIDFGIAKVQYSGSDEATRTVTFVGTVNYVAPEQLMGQSTTATDIYALGVVAYEMLAGRLPLEAETPFGMYERQKAGEVVPLSRLRPDLPHAVDQVICRALSFDARRRQPTPKQFAEELSAAFRRGPSRQRKHALMAGIVAAAGLTAAVLPQVGKQAERILCSGESNWPWCPAPTISTVAGGDAASLGHVYGIASDRNGTIYFSSTGRHQIYRFRIGDPSGATLVAGTGTMAFGGDGGDPRRAHFNNPVALAVDSAGDLYITDQNNARIRKISFREGTIRTIAGSGVRGYAGDGGAPQDAQLSSPMGLAFDSTGRLFIADYGNHRVRMVRFGANPIITTVVGSGIDGFDGDGGVPESSRLSGPTSVIFDGRDNLLIGDQHNNRIRRVVFGPTPSIRTIVGSGAAAFSGDGGHPLAAAMSGPVALAMDSAGNLYVTDSENHCVRKVTFEPESKMTTIAGDGLAGFRGDGGPSSSARLSLPTGATVGADGNLYIADCLNDRIRRVKLPAVVD